MSCVPPPVGGRVSAIKSQFENLSSIESLDISSPKPKKASVRFQFQRAATSLDLINRNDKVKSIVKTWSTPTNNVPRQHSDSSLLSSQRSNIAKQPDDQHRSSLKRTKETADVKLARHTSDPVKRSSIKRSPAFRVGEKQNKTVLIRQSQITCNEIEENKLEKFLTKSCNRDMERLQQSGLTDSLKAALRQPLPSGPPPRKPPRTFHGGSPETDRILEETCERELSPSPPKSNTTSPQIQDKINFLESHLSLKNGPKSSSPAAKVRAPLQKSKTELMLQSSKLLDCISCHRESTPVYDSVNTEDSMLVPLLEKSRTTCLVGRKPAEHIYMEPFGHLNRRDERDGREVDQKACSSNGSNVNCATKSEGICSCPKNHKTPDAHYLCTVIGGSKPDDDFSEKEGSISLEKTYDEINILLNAAFQQKLTGPMSSLSNEGGETRHSTNLSRSLTEKRKDYVRRVSLAPNQLQVKKYGTLSRTFKSPVVKTFTMEDDRRNNNSENNDNVNCKSRIDNTLPKVNRRSIRHKEQAEESGGEATLADCEMKPIEINEVVNTPEVDYTQKIFQVCMLVGYNTSTNTAYIKSKYPEDEPIPDNIEQLVFPSNQLIRSGRENQEYCLILTDDNGFKVYGYCRRIMPENCEMCLPLAYCIISVTKALGFYQKLLKEIESRHGQSEAQLNFMLKNLQNSKMPMAGKYLHIKVPLSVRPKTIYSSNLKISPKRLSLEANPKWLKESAAQAAFAESEYDVDRVGRKLVGMKSLMGEFEDNRKHSPPFDLSLISRSLISRDSRFDEILLRRPNDLRLENIEISDLLECLGPDLLMNIFASLLHERKVILQGKNLSLVSKSILALDTILYPFRWQYTIVTILPQSLIEICQAPFPVLAGVLEEVAFEIEDGILVDMDLKEIVQSCGDEHLIIPGMLRKSTKLSLEMVDLIDQGKMLSSVLISEAFLRFFVELFADSNRKRFHKNDFIQAHQEQNIKFFLEWFLETSMFRHFRNERYVDEANNATSSSTELLRCDSFYNIFDARLMEKSENKTKTSQNIETIVKNSKIINKKGKTFKDRFKQLLG